MTSISTFATFLSEEKSGKNLHLSHLEDLIFEDGIVGLRNSIQFLQNLRDMLAGHSSSGAKLTTKWDGAPAIFCGINPDNGKFFVATKGAFAANPKLCYTAKDVDTYYPDSGLNPKLKIALEYLPDLGINNVLQGDMMFTDGDVKTETIDGEKYVTFRPNTITYAIPADSELARRVLAAKLGIVFHTTYRGKPFAAMKASFGADISPLRPSRNVWYRDASFVDAAGVATFTEAETKTLTNLLRDIGNLFRQLNPEITNRIASMEKFRVQIMAWNNSKMRSGEGIRDINGHIQGFIKDQDAKLSKFALEAKKQDTRNNRTKEKNEVMRFWRDRKTLKNLQITYEINNLIVQAKLMIVRKLEQVQDIGTFLKTDKGFRVTKAEGFVSIDHLTGGAVKLVDRLVFSHANMNLAKDWQK
jgi:hypothetical protein